LEAPLAKSILIDCSSAPSATKYNPNIVTAAASAAVLASSVRRIAGDGARRVITT
jgi:hypothetical protein